MLLVALVCVTVSVDGFRRLALTRTHSGLHSMRMVAIGEAAPDFALSTASGSVVKLSSFKGKKPVVIFFYPADNTPGCTKEACAFERKAPDFKALGAEIIGISSGKKEDKEKFIRANKLNNMQLLIDAGDVARYSFHSASITHALSTYSYVTCTCTRTYISSVYLLLMMYTLETPSKFQKLFLVLFPVCSYIFSKLQYTTINSSILIYIQIYTNHMLYFHLFIAYFSYLYLGRVTYVVGKDGKVVSIYDDLANAEMHPEKALAALKSSTAKK